MKTVKIEIAALIAFILCVFISAYNLDRECDGIRESILRLHVIAASDSDYDQKVKLQLRDRLLLKGSEIFSESKTKQEAEIKLEKGLEILTEEANAYLESISYPYKATVTLGKARFPTRRYEGYTLPAGIYDALKVTVGKGEGQNWWCVMFPALCLPAAKKDISFEGILTEKEQKFITEEKFEIRFWLIEKWQEIEKNFYVQ
ncbi:MAG: stage II sporulation protein R [Clostridia bacterium]|nr:stage II sporulation protein R [Clostridia bacterium]